MAVENWIDEIAKLAAVDDGRGGKVHSYRVFERAEFPESLSVFPCALTYTVSVQSIYSDSGPCIDMWRGHTEYHLTPTIDKSQYPFIMRFFARIRNAFALHRKLGGKVEYCTLLTEEPGIVGPVILTYGSEEPHLGIIVKWLVKENTSGQFTLGQ
jgi:hypothetical protein